MNPGNEPWDRGRGNTKHPEPGLIGGPMTALACWSYTKKQNLLWQYRRHQDTMAQMWALRLTFPWNGKWW